MAIPMFFTDDVLVTLLTTEPASNVAATQPSTIGVIERPRMATCIWWSPPRRTGLSFAVSNWRIGESSGATFLTNTANGSGWWSFDDLTATNQASRFYRDFYAVTPGVSPAAHGARVVATGLFVPTPLGAGRSARFSDRENWCIRQDFEPATFAGSGSP